MTKLKWILAQDGECFGTSSLSISVFGICHISSLILTLEFFKSNPTYPLTGGHVHTDKHPVVVKRHEGTQEV